MFRHFNSYKINPVSFSCVKTLFSLKEITVAPFRHQRWTAILFLTKDMIMVCHHFHYVNRMVTIECLMCSVIYIQISDNCECSIHLFILYSALHNNRHTYSPKILSVWNLHNKHDLDLNYFFSLLMWFKNSKAKKSEIRLNYIFQIRIVDKSSSIAQ